MGVTVTFNKADVIKRITKTVDTAQVKLSKMALEDITKYTKEDTGDLKRSGEKESKLEDGLLIWDTDYARYQYYLRATRTKVNPNAHFMWAHYGEKRHGKQWRRFLQSQIDRGV